MTMHHHTTIPSPSQVADSSYTVSDIQWRTKLYTYTFNILGEAIPLCVIHMFTRNWGP